MPHLWMFLLQALTPAGHEVVLIDGNTRPMSDVELVQFVVDERVGLVGIGAMTRMIAKAYRVADSIRAAGIPVVMGGPHVTEVPEEALGRNGEARHADALALGEADETWPLIVEDAARGQLKEIYTRDRRIREGSQADVAGLPGNSLGFSRPAAVQSNSGLCASPHAPHGLCHGRHFTSFPLSPDAAVLMDASSARSPGSSATRSASDRTRASSTRCSDSSSAPATRNGQVAVFFVDDNFAINAEAHQVPSARHHCRGSRAFLGGANQRQPACATRNCWI